MSLSFHAGRRGLQLLSFLNWAWVDSIVPESMSPGCQRWSRRKRAYFGLYDKTKLFCSAKFSPAATSWTVLPYCFALQMENMFAGKSVVNMRAMCRVSICFSGIVMVLIFEGNWSWVRSPAKSTCLGVISCEERHEVFLSSSVIPSLCYAFVKVLLVCMGDWWNNFPSGISVWIQGLLGAISTMCNFMLPSSFYICKSSAPYICIYTHTYIYTCIVQIQS